jgi:putative SOS response-associated peptidase YedK
LPNWAGLQVRWRISKAGEKTFTWQGERKSHFNSRWDTISNPGNRYWNGLLESRRCLIPADGFVEWPDEAMIPKGQDKIPKFFFLKNRSPFYFAGLYETLPDDTGAPFTSFNVITVKPNSLLEGLPHHRMPAILGPENIAKWINPTIKADEAAKLLGPLPPEAMDAPSSRNRRGTIPSRQ